MACSIPDRDSDVHFVRDQRAGRVMAADPRVPRRLLSRSYMCPVCGLEFLVVYRDGDPLHHVTTRIDCQRGPDGQALFACDGPLCPGRIVTELPPEYRVVPALQDDYCAAPPTATGRDASARTA